MDVWTEAMLQASRSDFAADRFLPADSLTFHTVRLKCF
jgi:hypothetical protein